MKRWILALPLLLFISDLVSQDLPEAYQAYRKKYPESPALNRQDSVFLLSIPEKAFPGDLRSHPLPPVVDNSELPYLRPVFMQEGPSCGQAAMVGYNFTYEMNCLRNLPASVEQTQYPTHFTWNFQNGGNGWYGVSYFHSIEILRLCGCMNSLDYGGFYDDGRRWISGYDLYYNSMFNRVKGVYSIPVGTAQGILALKHWLYNHMGEGDFGGVASFYANTPWNAQTLKDTTPEGGKYVMTEWYPYASHAMTIVGYNDSIRWDYNNDGLYTNNIDLNEDGIIDPRDWEIGGVKFVNSHGLEAQDSGFCYMMYKCLAETFDEGGIWNQSVHLLDVVDNYEPVMTFKVTLKHNSRDKIKVMAGVSADTSDLTPRWHMDFPIIDYQGADHYLQGQDTAENLQYLEFGLDITPLLSYLQPGEPAKFFLIVDENDPDQEGDGEITSFSLMDYTSGTQEVISTEAPADLESNSRTIASLVHLPVFDMVQITSESLPVFAVNQPYLYQMQASGGTPDYNWELLKGYRQEGSSGTFPIFDENKVLFHANDDTIVPIALGFSFPFFGESYDTAYMHINGHLQFDNAQLPWPYLLEPWLHFRSNRLIAPMTNMSFTIAPADGDGGWVLTEDTAVTFRWKLSATFNVIATDINFAVRITRGGQIEFLYGLVNLEGIDWIGGISAGNKQDFYLCPFSGDEEVEYGTTVLFTGLTVPLELHLSDEGQLSGTMTSDVAIHDISFRVTDQMGISHTKTLQFSSGPYLLITVDGKDEVNFGDTVNLDLEIRNAGGFILSDPILEISSQNPFVQFIDPLCQPGSILPGQTLTLQDVFQIVVSDEVTDLLGILFQCCLTTDANIWYKDLILTAVAPNLLLKSAIIDDEVNGRLDPGETAPLLITYQNQGHASVDHLIAELYSLDPEVQIIGNNVQEFGTIIKGASVARTYQLHASETAPEGMTARFILSATSLQGIQRTDTINLRIGRTPAMVIDMDPNHHSAPGIWNQLIDLGIYTDYHYTIPENISDYQSLFISLGYHNSNHVLTADEGTRLAQYLLAGGQIYMEGKKTWKDDPITALQPLFNIGYAGNVTIYDTLTGVDTTFTVGTRLLNGTHYNLSFYHLVPLPPAFTILQDNNLFNSCAVAYDAGTYRTIGSLFDFGTLIDLNPSLKSDLMLAFLDFFGIHVDPVGVVEKEEVEMRWSGNLEVWPNPATDKITVGSRSSAIGGWPERGGTEGDARRAPGCQKTKNDLLICDMMGHEVLLLQTIDDPPLTIDISALSDGVYFLRMRSGKGTEKSARFLKFSR